MQDRDDDDEDDDDDDDDDDGEYSDTEPVDVQLSAGEWQCHCVTEPAGRDWSCSLSHTTRCLVYK